MAADAFLIGWTEAAHGIAAETAREVLSRYPVFTADDVTLYLNGAEDGAKGDRWRLAGGKIIPRSAEQITLEWHDMAERTHSVGCSACNAGACPWSGR